MTPESADRRIGFEGAPILVEFRPNLKAFRGQLHCGGSRGAEVHAGSFLQERRIVLDSALLRDRAERDRILAHEIFHFVWWKLGAAKRARYEALIVSELDNRIPGEMGWSAEWRKQQLTVADLRKRSQRWREYLGESFCDSAAAQLLALRKHREITLNSRTRRRRALCLEVLLPWDRLRI